MSKGKDWSIACKWIVQNLENPHPKLSDLHYYLLSANVPVGYVMHYASLSTGDTTILQFLHENGFDVNEVNDEGETPLHWACTNGNIKVVEKLHNLGANLQARDNAGNYPLHRAAAGNIAIVKYLIAHHCDLNCTNNEGLTPLNIAIEQEEQEIENIILSKLRHKNNNNGNNKKTSLKKFKLDFWAK